MSELNSKLTNVCAEGANLMSELNNKLKTRQVNQDELSVSPAIPPPYGVTKELVSISNPYLWILPTFSVIIGAKRRSTKKR